MSGEESRRSHEPNELCEPRNRMWISVRDLDARGWLDEHSSVNAVAAKHDCACDVTVLRNERFNREGIDLRGVAISMALTFNTRWRWL